MDRKVDSAKKNDSLCLNGNKKAKLPYNRPVLKKYGLVQSLTAGGSGMASEGAGGGGVRDRRP